MKNKYSNTDRKHSFYHTIPKRGVLFITPLLAVFLFASVARASIFSFVSSILGSEQVSAKTNSISYNSNSQTIALLQAAVNIDPNPEKSSDIIPVNDGKILDADIAASDIDDDSSANTQISIYIVRQGDTISDIAKLFGVSVNTIVWANDISRASALKAGQTLIILPVTGINYTVKKGDTIGGIVSKHKADMQEVLKYNDITISSALIPGQTIIIPDVELQVSLPTKILSKSGAYGTNGPSYSGYYIRPINGGTKTQGLHGYNGIDLGAYVGTPILAAADGIVIRSLSGGWNGGYGNYIIISHSNGTQTLYAHNSKNLVSVGDRVEQGQTIALVGSTGKSTGSHLHFEIRGAKNPF